MYQEDLKRQRKGQNLLGDSALHFRFYLIEAERLMNLRLYSSLRWAKKRRSVCIYTNRPEDS